MQRNELQCEGRFNAESSCMRTIVRRAIFLFGLAVPLLGFADSAEEALQGASSPVIERGRYLVGLLGCEGCHTPGAMMGGALGTPLSGSSLGIAYGQDVDSSRPPIVFPSNLTPDNKTGLGRWSAEQIVTAITSGLGAHGEPLVSVMPWLNYHQLKNDDAAAIAQYLKSLPAAANDVPERVEKGVLSRHRYVRFGVYLFVPEVEAESAR